MHVPDGMTVKSLSARLQHGSCVPSRVKPKIITYHLCQIALNQKLLHTFGKCVNFQVMLK